MYKFEDNCLNFENIKTLVKNEPLALGEGILYARCPCLNVFDTQVLSSDIVIAGFIMHGTLDMKINGNTFKVSEGSLYQILPGSTVDYMKPAEGCEGRLIIATSNTMLRFISDVDFYRYMLHLRENPIIEPTRSGKMIISDYFKLIDIKLSSAEIWKYPQLSRNYLLCALLIELLESINSDGFIVSKGYDKVFERFMQLLASVPVHNHSVEWYASRLNMTGKYLSKACSKCSGRTASAWIKEYCMVDIKRYLKDRSLSIKEVAFKLGYADLSFFGKCVRRWFGVSPKTLREKLNDG